MILLPHNSYHTKWLLRLLLHVDLRWGYKANFLRPAILPVFQNYQHTGYLTMTPPNGNIFRVIGPLCGEFTGHRWIPLTKSSDVEL